jgi:hypothetical protein
MGKQIQSITTPRLVTSQVMLLFNRPASLVVATRFFTGLNNHFNDIFTSSIRIKK